MNTFIIEKNIIVHPSSLTKNFSEDFIDTIRVQEIGKCYKEYGYILDILDNPKIKDNKILNSGYIKFLITFKAQTFKPTIDLKLNAKIVAMYENSILLEANSMKLIIPSKNLEFKYISKTTCLLDDKKIEISDNIKVIITQIKYQNKSFNCITKLDLSLT